MNNEELKLHARNIRKNIIRQVSEAKCGHPGGALGAADILTLLYFEIMDINETNVGSIDRDRFVLSKGHSSPLLYAVLSEKGFLPEEELLTFRKIDSRLQGHPNMNYVKGVDMSTGSLGQGLAAADGMAIANRLSGNSHRVYCLVGDGESEEGEIWEAAMAAAHYKSDNLCAIIDVNGLQIDGTTDEVIGPNPLDEKFKAFGWHVINVDGHDFDALRDAFKEAAETKGKPTAIVAKTIKGKGVSFMENQVAWHGVAPDAEQTKIALADLDKE
ncbi:MAG: transketolase [Solobacterium sp.]|nr:transketolase [Solobacterium sp.]